MSILLAILDNFD